MRHWCELLETVGHVQMLDYPYLLAGQKRPDPLPRLVAAHRAALETVRESHTGPVFLIGKSMGGRIGCHVALETKVDGVICLSYPLCAGGDCTKLRDRVLRELRTPILFVQGTRDALCPLEVLASIRAEMSAPHDLYVVEGGDHSLLVTKTQLKHSGETQADCDQRTVTAIRDFVLRRIGIEP
jgi:predicted alpha/beta-hydrolase family hydrolase